MKAPLPPRPRYLAALAACALLAACSPDKSELQSWMDETRANAPRKSSRIPEPKRFEPFRYAVTGDIDPFSNTKLQVALAKFSERNRGGIKPDLNRRREPLEQYPLDSIRMVGHLQRASTGSVALLEADRVVFQARMGQYLGQNFGRITNISETGLTVKELVQDAAGDWVERDTALQLQESKKQ